MNSAQLTSVQGIISQVTKEDKEVTVVLLDLGA